MAEKIKGLLTVVLGFLSLYELLMYFVTAFQTTEYINYHMFIFFGLVSCMLFTAIREK